MKKIAILLLFQSCSLLLYSQDFVHAIGVRGGVSSGIEYRQFLDYNNSVKLLLSSRQRGLQLHGLYEFHIPNLFSFSSQLSFVYGAGIHAGYQRWDKISNEGQNSYTEVKTAPLAGFDGLAGLEYYIGEIPFSVGLEVKPFLDFGGRYGFNAVPWDFAFTIKYLF